MADGSFGGYSSEASAAAGEEGPMVMEPLAVEKGQPEKAAALCVEKPVDAISDASDGRRRQGSASDGGRRRGSGSDGCRRQGCGSDRRRRRGSGSEGGRRQCKQAPATRSREGLTALPKDEVERVLSWKRGKLTSIYSTPEAIEVFEALSDMCAEYQARFFFFGRKIFSAPADK